MTGLFARFAVRVIDDSDMYQTACTYPSPFAAIGDAFKYADAGYAVEVTKYPIGSEDFETLLTVEPRREPVSMHFSGLASDFDVVDSKDIPTDRWMAGDYKINGPLLDWLASVR